MTSNEHGAGGWSEPPAWGTEPDPATTAQYQPPPLRPPRSVPAAVLLNLTGLALGYFYLGRWKRGCAYLAGTVGLVTVAFATGAAELPWLWRAVAAGWLVWMAIDGWRLARRTPKPAGARQEVVPVGVGVVLVGAMVAGYLAYGAIGRQTFADGVTAQGRADCATASNAFGLVTSFYELTLSRDVPAAGVRTGQCAEFVAAGQQRSVGEFADSARRYRELRSAFPGGELVPFVGTELQATFLAWAKDRRADGDQTGAIEIYRDALTEPAPDPAVRPELAATYLERAAAGRTAPVPLPQARAAIDDLLAVQREFADTPSAAVVPQAIIDTFTAANTAVAEQRFCDAVPVLDYFVSLPDAETAGVVGAANADRARSLYECGLAQYRSGDVAGTLSTLDTFVAAYPDDPGIPQARSALIAARVASVKGGPALPLPAPLGDNSPGNILVTLYNDNPNEAQFFVAGPTAHVITLPGCPGCPPSYPSIEAACPSVNGKPSATLRLAPGTYDVLLTFAGGGSDRVETRVYGPGFDYTECGYVYQEF